ncbi:hypothetical protein DFH07DRAFT_986483 [Mycena maculata]|uniref:Uncharacterized protein n=1 Tax=Mycena maculata TaxID=230809 RepID=A0AAD7NTE6_9AGAR|nr:hypothetical protein DFH07DRAFT_986483 [Mycena maculata]
MRLLSALVVLAVFIHTPAASLVPFGFTSVAPFFHALHNPWASLVHILQRRHTQKTSESLKPWTTLGECSRPRWDTVQEPDRCQNSSSLKFSLRTQDHSQDGSSLNTYGGRFKTSSGMLCKAQGSSS